MKFITISGDITDKYLTACGVSAQSHLGFLFLIKQEYLNTDYGNIIENHECIHFAQAREWGIILWYILYVGHFLIRYVINLFKMIPSKSKEKTWLQFFKDIFWISYREIIFEVEAKQNEENMDYLCIRKHYAYWRK